MLGKREGTASEYKIYDITITRSREKAKLFNFYFTSTSYNTNSDPEIGKDRADLVTRRQESKVDKKMIKRKPSCFKLTLSLKQK